MIKALVMSKWILLLMTLSITVVGRGLCTGLEDHPEVRLRDRILKNNNPYIRPVQDISKPVILQHDLYLLKIQDLNEYKETITTSVWTNMLWTDEFLSWNATEFEGISTIVVPATQIWLPDYCISNRMSNNKCNWHFDEFKVVLEASGRVIYWDNAEMTTRCDVVITKFPFDTQTCEIRVGMGISEDKSVDIEPMYTTINLSNYESSGEWVILDTFYERKLLTGEKNFTEIVYFFTIQRRPLYYILVIIVPLLVLSVLDLSCFFLPIENGEKMGMSMAIFLTYAVFLTLINETTPKSSEHIFALGFYLCWLLILSAIVVLTQVFILYIYHKKKNQKANIIYRCIANRMPREISREAGKDKLDTGNSSKGMYDSMGQSAENGTDWARIADAMEKLFLYLTLAVHFISLIVFLGFTLT